MDESHISPMLTEVSCSVPSRICIIYEDGAVIVGTVDGQRCGDTAGVVGSWWLNKGEEYVPIWLDVSVANSCFGIFRTPSAICFRACHGLPHCFALAVCMQVLGKGGLLLRDTVNAMRSGFCPEVCFADMKCREETKD